MKSNIQKFAAKSPLMNMIFKYGDELFKFNLYEELVIDENVIGRELKQQPQAVAFLGLLSSKLTRFLKDKQIELKKSEAELKIKFKSRGIDGIDRPTRDDLLAKVDCAPKIIKLKREVIKLEENVQDINTAIKAFETRTFMLQTLSANTRNKS